MQYPIAIAVAFGEIGFQTNNMVIGTKIVIRDMILKIFFIFFPFCYSIVKSNEPVKFSASTII